MQIRKLLQNNHSKQATDAILQYVGRDPIKMEVLMSCLFDEDIRLCQRASWPIGKIANKHPQLVYPYLKDMLENLERPNHDAVVRNTLRTWSFMEIPEDVAGNIYEKCFSYLADPNKAIAIRVFSMTVCGNICKRYPDLREELIEMIDLYLPYGSAGYRSRAKRIKQALGKI